ncbi:hypothetical protein BGZ59_004598 [Podila verticillata]|nr:hypothetical protein BGZ59_004598 [Podila verticillata]
MALPNLPDTRRLKAIIPGARIQVQIQIPNIIPIPGYAQTSQLVPCSKTGGLVPVKGAIISPNLSDRYFGYSMKGKIADGTQRADPRYPDNFQVALTVRKVTQSDIGVEQTAIALGDQQKSEDGVEGPSAKSRQRTLLQDLSKFL